MFVVAHAAAAAALYVLAPAWFPAPWAAAAGVSAEFGLGDGVAALLLLLAAGRSSGLLSPEEYATPSRRRRAKACTVVAAVTVTWSAFRRVGALLGQGTGVSPSLSLLPSQVSMSIVQLLPVLPMLLT